MLPFEITDTDPQSSARAAELSTPHGVVRTPAFMPVGTAGTVKGMAAWELERLAPEMVLANTYHLMLRPGAERIVRLGGLHRIMGWTGPILTDSGGYQVFSLANRRKMDAKAEAILNGRFAVTREDVHRMVRPALRHRLVMRFNAVSEGVHADEVLDVVLETIQGN